MQGISKSKHEHLVEALQHLEGLLFFSDNDMKLKSQVQTENGSTDVQQDLKDAIIAREELQQLYLSYNITLKSLAAIISKYDKLYYHLRSDFVAKRLKELKREMPITDEQFRLLRESIHSAYGT
ncbi:MAG: hypothetical protein EOP47_19090 [Sphingobacteriaceae bacterium]|nr:MAG: hypothetical protein EOP47_19090 [Sphingobacteriaceae bacterium]